MRTRMAPKSSATSSRFFLSGAMRIVALACLVMATLGLVLHDFPFLPNMDRLHSICFVSGNLFATAQIVELPLATLGSVSVEKVHLLQGVALLSSGLSPPLI